MERRNEREPPTTREIIQKTKCNSLNFTSSVNDFVERFFKYKTYRSVNNRQPPPAWAGDLGRSAGLILCKVRKSFESG